MAEEEVDPLARAWSAEERDEYLRSLGEHALFADQGEAQDSSVWDAMIALREEDGDTPETLCLHFKQKGNDLFKSAQGKRVYLQNALTAYAEALGYGSRCEQTDEQKQQQSIVWANIAAVNLKIRNLGKVKRECDCALALWPGNVKACFRSASARHQLQQYADAVEYAQRGLAIEPDNEPLQKLLAKASAAEEERLAALAARQAADEAAAREATERLTALQAACALRSVQMGPAILNTELYDGWPAEAEDGVMLWPCVFLYPEYGQSDFIQCFPEVATFEEQLAQMFPKEGPFCEWDVKHAYKYNKLEVWFEVGQATPYPLEDADAWRPLLEKGKGYSQRAQRVADEDKRWLRVSRSTELYKVLMSPDYVVPAFPVFHVFVRGSKFHSNLMRELAGRVEQFRPPADAPPLPPQ